jgi:hypothetical protein
MQQPFQFYFGSFAAVCLAGFLSATVNAQEGRTPDLTHIISRVRENVASMHKQLPNFVCQEDVSQQITDGNKTVEKKHYRISLQALHRPNDSTNQFSESRHVISATLDGKILNDQKYDPPIHWLRGGLARDLFTYFDAPTSGCYEFNPVRGGEATDSNTLALDVTLSKNTLPADCAHIPAQLSSARVWIDLTAFQVIRIEEHTGNSIDFSTPFARTNGKYVFTPVIEYSPVRIHDLDYWLPQRKSIKFIKTKGQYANTWISQYSDYHKFEASATIIDIQPVE